MKPVAMVGWTGLGRIEDLMSTVGRKLALHRQGVSPWYGTLVVPDDDPTTVVRRLARLPGVSWLGAGSAFEGREEYTDSLAQLSARYVRKGKVFRVVARASGGPETEGDYVLAGNSAVMSAVPGSRPSVRDPDITFRVTAEGGRGTCGVQLREGAGGSPTRSNDHVNCLVSGGPHSSAMAWMAALSGFAVTLVHARTDEISLKQVAGLYAEMAFRMDASSLDLLVLDGHAIPGARLRGWLSGATAGPVLAGIHPECHRGEMPHALLGGVSNIMLPLLLVQEDMIVGLHESLGLKDKASTKGILDSLPAEGLAYVPRRFGGREADMNEVIDSITAPRNRRSLRSR